jgi:hypothetical protein
MNKLIKRASWSKEAMSEMNNYAQKKTEELNVVTSGSETKSVPINNPLNGYDASMRRHAAACEAGR